MIFSKLKIQLLQKLVLIVIKTILLHKIESLYNFLKSLNVMLIDVDFALKNIILEIVIRI